jgi:uncharacterized membrane protein YgaE (UPF0421/DUF939 family)
MYNKMRSWLGYFFVIFIGSALTSIGFEIVEHGGVVGFAWMHAILLSIDEGVLAALASVGILAAAEMLPSGDKK